jgi:vacuolar-type H+-ATPase subunit H
MGELTPLEQIRRAEDEAARRIAAARRAAETTWQEAKVQATDLKRQADEAGRREGEAQRQEIIRGAQERARALVAEAQRRAEALRHQGELHMDMGIRHALSVVAGQGEQAEDV